MDAPTPRAAYDFGGATFDLESPRDREIIRFILSQALYGEATGVYCGRSLYAARSLEAARFYARQARQELKHLEIFADIFRALDLRPEPGHWVVRLLATHNDYYPVKVLVEHALGEGMVLDVFKDLLLQTLPDSDPRIPGIKKKLRAICREEEQHVAWGEKETRRILEHSPWLRTPFYGLLELQMLAVPVLARAMRHRAEGHPVLGQAEAFLADVRARVYDQGRALGFVPPAPPGPLGKLGAMTAGAALYARSRFAKSRSRLDRNYLSELGFDDPS
jgi:hypothetical protein